jgi:DNA topoisomerase-1
MDNSNKTCEKCGKPMAIREGRFGQFLACTGYPECKNTKQIHPLDQPKDNFQISVEDKTCDKCGKPMAIKHGRYGPFLACTGYPDCKNIKNIEQKTGVACPQCSKGDIVAKRSRQGKTFYSCNRYPECKFALWSKPTGEKCPECESLLVFSAGDKIRCSSKECKFEKSLEEK